MRFTIALVLGLLAVVGLSAGPSPRDNRGPGGIEPQVDFPASLWMRNVGSKLDGAGMCVFTSFEHAALWAGLEEFRGFRDWCAARYPGGGYPQKLARLVHAYCDAKRIPREVFDPDRDLVQYEGPSTDLLERALKNGWMPCVTLYQSPRYGGGTIYHMVNASHLDAEKGAIQDNNFEPYEWASREESIRRWKRSGQLWCVVLVRPGPPAAPRVK